MIQIADIGQEISSVGLLVGLLTPGANAGTVDINTDWFSDPITNLKQCGERLNDLVSLIDATLGPPAQNAPAIFTDAQWYAIPDPQGDATIFQIVASAPADTTGQIGLGMLYPFNFGAVSGSAYVYLPLFSYNPTSGVQLIVDGLANPCQIGVWLTSPTPFQVTTNSGTVTFTAINLALSLYLNPAAYQSPLPNFVQLTFENLKGTTKPATYTSLSALLDPDVEAWLLQVVIQSGSWLNTYLGNTSFTLGDVLEAASILAREYTFQSGNFTDVPGLVALLTASSPDPVSAYVWSQLPGADQTVLKNSGSTEPQQAAALVDGLNTIVNSGASIYDSTRFAGVALSPETTTLLASNPTGAGIVMLNRLLLDDAYATIQPNPYSLNLASLQGTPAQIALNLFFSVLNTLSMLGVPLISLPGGGIYITARKNQDQSEDFGLRLVLNLPLNASQDPASTAPVVTLCLGTWLTGETDSSNWMTRSGGTADSYPPGVSVLFLHRDPANNLTFVPSFELVSIGFNLAGPGNKPLVNVQGYTFEGTDLRIFLFPGDPIQPLNQWAYGFGVRLDNFGFPLAPGAGTGSGGNGVAQNLLSSGSSAGGSGADQQPVNPAFSAAVAWRSDSTNSPKFNLQLFDATGSPSGTVWIPVQRSFGPVTCQRIGVGYNTTGPKLFIYFDGDVTLGPLEVDLIALSIGIPITTPLTLSQYSLGLKGMAVSYTSGPLSIQGGLDEDDTVTPTEYNGSLLIQAAAWSISAVGSYASLNGHPSLFVFARLGATIGGPPCFFVTGLCAGFGYNRSLQIPAQDQVPSFPLLSGISDPSSIGGANPSPAQALSKLSVYVPPAQGVNWFAAGVQFTSFELVQSNVVLAVIVTGDFEAAILGLSRVKLPQVGSFQFAYVELGIEIVLHPSAGFFGVSAVITSNSFVLDPACHLTGGFAFYLWFAKPADGSADHSGDFVITLGGYHPAFVKPAWYPDEARLGFSWQISDVISLSGGAYFALTPSCVMGGGSLDLEFHSGDLRAWFTAQADFLFHWKPFYFQGDISVSIGASYKLNLGFCSCTISAQLGASLTIQGPPVAGRVTIDWYIISFSIPFGPNSQAPSAVIDWADFSLMLPQNDSAKSPHKLAVAGAPEPLTNVCKIIASAGLSSTIPNPNNPGSVIWLVRASAFTFAAQTTFPLTEADSETPAGGSVKLYPQSSDPTPSVAVRPMAISSSDMQSTMLIALVSDAGTPQDFTKWTFTPNLGAVPAAMWGTPDPNQPSTPTANTVAGNLLGLNALKPLPPTLYGPPQIPIVNLAFDPIDQDNSQFLSLSPQQQGVTPGVTVDPKSLQTIASTIADSAVVTTRTSVFAALLAFGYDASLNGSTAELSAQVNLNYPDAPLLGAPWTNQ